MNDLLIAMMGRWPVWVAALALLTAAAAGLGAAAVRIGGPLRRGTVAVELVLGIQLLGFLGLSAAPWVLRAPDAALWGAAGIAAAAGLWRWMRLASARRTAALCRRDWPALTLLAAGMLYAFSTVLIPPYAWDEQTYQLALPMDWLRTGSAAATADNPYSAFPSLPQFVLLWGIRLGGLGTARLLILGAYALGYWMLYGELRRLVRRPAALILVLTFALSPVAGAMMREVYVEPFVLLALLAALRLRRCRNVRGGGRAVVFGLLAGWTAAIKLTALGAAAAVTLAGWPERCEGAWRRRGKLLLLLAGAAAAAGAGFYLRPWIALGNPVYPFAAGWFGGGEAGAAVERFHYLMGSYYYGLSGLKGIGLGWFFVAFDEVIFDGITTGWQFALLAVLTAAAALWRRRGGGRFDGRTGVPLGMVLILYGYWSVTAQQARFLLPAYPLLLCAFAALWRDAARRWLAAALAGLVLATAVSVDRQSFLHFLRCWKMADRPPAAVLGHAIQEPEYVAALDFLATRTEPDARVLLVFERRGLYVPRAHRNGTPYFQEWIFTPVPADADAVHRALTDRGIDYLLVGASARNPDHLDAYNQANADLAVRLRELLRAGRLEYLPIPGGGAYTLLRVKP